MATMTPVPEIRYTKSAVEKTIGEGSLEIIIREDVFLHVEAMKDSTFTATNGFQITLSKSVADSFATNRLRLCSCHAKLTGGSYDTEKLSAALDELANSYTSTWTAHGSVPNPADVTKEYIPKILTKMKCTKRVEEIVEISLFIRNDVFEWAKKKEYFTASNGITIGSGGCSPEYSATLKKLWLSNSFGGKSIDMRTYLKKNEYTTFVLDFPLVLVALKEFKETFLLEKAKESKVDPDISTRDSTWNAI